jgi:ornithine cyclodeaminase
MHYIDAATVSQCLSTEPLISALSSMFTEGCTTPVRHSHSIYVPDAADGSLLLMPAWRIGAYLGTKLVTVFPENSTLGIPAVSSLYILYDANRGTPLAFMDGDTLTARRTAATSALAARYLARNDATSLLVVGSGRIARELAVTYWAARPNLCQIRVWSRTSHRAEALVHDLRALGLPVETAENLEHAARDADIVSVATLSTEPLLRHAWIRPGAHIDLVGAFRHGMREAEDALVANSRIVCDTRAGVLAEADDIRVPITRGLVQESNLLELAELCSGTAPGRTHDNEITLFKSVGAALEDLAAAIVVYNATQSV